VVPFVDLKAQYHSIKPEIDAAVIGVFESTQFVLGSAVAAFEKAFAPYCKAEYAVGMNSGTSAIQLAILAAGIGRGDEVITTPFTFVATVSAIDFTNAKPVFVDCDPETLTIDPAKIEAAITPRTKAIVVVHLHGLAVDMDAILAIARKHNLKVIEDACQAHGAAYKGRPVGSLGHAAAFSFYPGKNLGAYGEGGMVVSSSESFAREVRMLRDWGAEKKYHHVLKGFNYRMEGLQGAMLRVKLQHLERWTEARRAHARDYAHLLVDAGVGLPAEADYARHVFHVYAVRTADRQSLQRTLQANGVATGIHYPIPVHLQPAYSDLGYKAGQFPESERAANEVLSLPMYPELSRTKLEMVAAAIRQEAYVG